MLSGATLVVVPAILVEHWKHEIAKHVKHALLRVYCIEDARSADIPAHQLAWDYDVVLTTFSHLSAYGATWQLRSREARHAILQVPTPLLRSARTPFSPLCSMHGVERSSGYGAVLRKLGTVLGYFVCSMQKPCPKNDVVLSYRHRGRLEQGGKGSARPGCI